MAFALAEFLNSFTSLTEHFVLIIITLSLLLLWRRWKNPNNLPPGPWCLPLIGYLPFLGKKAHVTFNELGKKYGGIFRLYVGRKLFIVLNDYETIKEAFIKQGDIFAGRLGSDLLQEGEPATIFVSEGETWKDYKRFTLRTLRDFGFGKLSIEPRIKEEVMALLKEIEDANQKPMDIGKLLRMSVSNVICTLLRGRRFDYNDEKFQHLINVLNQLVNDVNQINPRLILPKNRLITMLLKKIGFIDGEDIRERLRTYIREGLLPRIKEHESGEANDYVSAWLTEAKNRGPENGKNFTDEHLVRMIFSLFAAGTDTTANTLRWSLLYLMEHPHVQARVQKEIDDIIGHERMPSTTDQERMPYTMATLMEVYRIATLVPLAIPHCNIEETTIFGYHIPKRSVILPNLWAVHNDPNTYPEPQKFRPERFLDKEGKVLKTERLIPFSIGKRQCLGESLAKMELFLYFTSMFQKFTFKKFDNMTLSFDSASNAVHIPFPFKTIAEKRT